MYETPGETLSQTAVRRLMGSQLELQNQSIVLKQISVDNGFKSNQRWK